MVIKFTCSKERYQEHDLSSIKIFPNDLKTSLLAIRDSAGEYAQDIKFVETENEIKRVDAE